MQRPVIHGVFHRSLAVAQSDLHLVVFAKLIVQAHFDAVQVDHQILTLPFGLVGLYAIAVLLIHDVLPALLDVDSALLFFRSKLLAASTKQSVSSQNTNSSLPLGAHLIIIWIFTVILLRAMLLHRFFGLALPHDSVD